MKSVLRNAQQINKTVIIHREIFAIIQVLCVVAPREPHAALWVRKFPPENFLKFIPIFPEIFTGNFPPVQRFQNYICLHLHFPSAFIVLLVS